MRGWLIAGLLALAPACSGDKQAKEDPPAEAPVTRDAGPAPRPADAGVTKPTVPPLPEGAPDVEVPEMVLPTE